jgi:hypothetical protein
MIELPAAELEAAVSEWVARRHGWAPLVRHDEQERT